MNIEISIIIPAYNEEKNIDRFLKELFSVLKNIAQPYEVLVVDDGSSDSTVQRAQNFNVRVIRHEKNLGYGRSVKDGIRAANGDIILIMDGDGTYEVARTHEMLRLIQTANMVVGKRIFSKKSANHFKNVTRRFFAYQVSYYSGIKVEDLNSGMKAFRKNEIMEIIDKLPDGFSLTSTMTVLYLITGKKIVYTPVVYDHRETGSKFVSSAQILAMTKLSFWLTLVGRPFKFPAQMACVVACSVLFSNIINKALAANVFLDVTLFIGFFLVSFFLLICYIYAMGRRICRL